MLIKNAENRGQLEFVSLENMVPQNHLLRKIDTAIDFKNIYEFVEDRYCEDNGRPSVDPVVLFKIVLIQHIYGISSLRRTLEEVSMNLAYRWFIGYPLNEAVPHFSTVSYNFKHRFNHATVEYVFRWVLKAAAEEGYLDTEAIFVDGTHIKASANLKKQAKKAVPKQAKRYTKELFEEVNKDREEHGKKPFSDDSDKKPPQEKETVVSTTDPESGVFHKGEHKKCFAYEAHTACDKNNFILGVHVTPGNVHDSVAFDSLYDELCKYYPEHKTVVADSAYKTPWICKRIFESGRVLSTCYTRPKSKENNHPWWAYVYDEYFDDVICPNTTHCIIPPQTGTATGNTKAGPIFAKLVPPEECAPKTPSAKKLCCAMSGRTMWRWQNISGTWRCTKSCTGCEKRRLSVCLPMRRKSTGCVTRSTEAWPR